MSNVLTQQKISQFRSARRDPSIAVVEGAHALKHAIRFGADVLEAVVNEGMLPVVLSIAPDIKTKLADSISASASEFAQLAPISHPTGVIALAKRRVHKVTDILADRSTEPVVVLDHPQRLDNIGAAIRVAAAADVAGVIVIGDKDPWSPAAIRAAAGLQFALPVAQSSSLPQTERPIIAIDADGAQSFEGKLPPRSVLVFGTERDGISAELIDRSESRLRLPMRPKVSSLNLATAVAAVLYGRTGG